MKFKARIMKTDIPINGVIRPKEVVEKFLNDPSKNKLPRLGEFGAPRGTWIENVSHEIFDMWLEGDYLVAHIRPLGPKGPLLEEAIRNGLSMAATSVCTHDGYVINEIETINCFCSMKPLAFDDGSTSLIFDIEE